MAIRVILVGTNEPAITLRYAIPHRSIQRSSQNGLVSRLFIERPIQILDYQIGLAGDIEEIGEEFSRFALI